MQLALDSGSATALRRSDSPSPKRATKLMIGGVAALTASAIAVAPVVQTGSAIEVQRHTVSLAAAVDITASPSEVYSGLLTNTFTNVKDLSTAWLASPFPLLNQVLENQWGYATAVGGLFTSVPESFKEFWNRHETVDPVTGAITGKKGGEDYLKGLFAALGAGDIGLAFDNFNNLMLRGVDNIMKPISAVFFSNDKGNVGLFEQVANNFAAVVRVMMNSDTLFKGIFQSIYSPITGALFAGARAIGTIVNQVMTGNLSGAFNAMVNTPGVVLDAFLNGFDYDPDDDIEAWSGLLSPKGEAAIGGPLQQFMISLPTKIAHAIDNTPAEDTDDAGIAVESIAPPKVSPMSRTAVSSSVTSLAPEPLAPEPVEDAAEAAVIEVDDTAGAPVAAVDDATTSHAAVKLSKIDRSKRALRGTSETTADAVADTAPNPSSSAASPSSSGDSNASSSHPDKPAKKSKKRAAHSSAN